MFRTAFIPDFEHSRFQMFLWHHISILLLIPDFNKGKVDFYSVFDQHTEKIPFESKSGIKSNFDFIEIRNKKQNTHVMPNYFENYF